MKSFATVTTPIVLARRLVSLTGEPHTGPALPFRGRHGSVGLAALRRFLDHPVNLSKTAVEVGDLVGLDGYRRGTALEKRRRLMDAWAKYCASAPAERDKVVPLRGAG